VQQLKPYEGNIGPFLTIDELFRKGGHSRNRIVGIDLTGSENRASGWCFLDGRHAITRQISTDAELIEATLSCQPNLVSIDSPLSLPKGRISVSDSDPGRKEYGIMRECERILKRRGINVYPSLIQSMQSLTARGMRLAETLRMQGIAVIESYPGAAQDIMGIPRKQKGKDLLRDGLCEFGVEGEFINQEVSHDELDAITSAVVGLFYQQGQYEALGNEAENYLIVPRIGEEKWSNTKDKK
jgi:predicted nuclease with RNAse H fold